MKRFISVLSILSILLLTSAVPTLSVSAADTVTFGGSSFTIDGVNYISLSENPELYTKLDFTDGKFAHVNDGYADSVENKTVGDFSTLTGKTDTGSHGNVLQVRGNADNKNQNTRLLSNKQVTGGVFVLNFDMYVSGDFYTNSDQFFSMATRNAAGTREWNSPLGAQIIYEKSSSGNWDICFKYPNGTKETLYTIPLGEWFNFALISDFRNHTFTIVINGEPKIVRAAMNDTKAAVTQDSFDTIGRIAKNGEYILYDNIVAYQYYPDYTAEVKGVASDSTLTEKVSYAQNSKIAVKFSTPMMISNFNGNISLVSENENEVDIKEIVESDYDKTANTLYLTAEEALKPNSKYTVILKPNTLGSDGAVSEYGVATVDGVSLDEDVELEIYTEKTPYGVESIDCPTLTSGATVTANVAIRSDSDVVDANLVLVLYVDGKMRSISSAEIDGTAVPTTKSLEVNVPSDGSKFVLCAMLLGADYQVIDVLSK